VASILVIVEFTIPLLAIMAVRKMLETENYLQRFGMVFYTVFGLGAIVCFLGWVAPSMFGEPYSASEIQQLQQAGAFQSSILQYSKRDTRDTPLSCEHGLVAFTGIHPARCAGNLPLPQGCG
jgi:hypothetical protein